MNARSLSVLIGPRIDLHPGIHGSLLATPPAPYRHVMRDATHAFFGTRRTRGFSPIRQRHAAECVSLGTGGVLVHSSRWPVLGRARWIVELDDLGYPMMFGRHGLRASFRSAFARPWSAALAGDIVQRAFSMLTAYAHPSCRRVVFRTQAALEYAEVIAQQLGLEREFVPVRYKCCVIRPAAAAIDDQAVRAKWQDCEPPVVLFCGREFNAKQGALALAVISGLLDRGTSLRYIHIGAVPAAARAPLRRFGDRVQFAGEIPQGRVQELMATSHILLHTSPAESVGMVFLEAAAAGMAVVASQGPRLPHLGELLDTRGFIGVGRSADLRKDENGFSRALASLIKDAARARGLGLANHRAAREGVSSVTRRNRAWREVYDQACECKAGGVLTARALEVSAGPTLARLSSQRLSQAIEEHLARNPAAGRTFHV